MDGLASAADGVDSKASQATGAIGALAGGLEAAGFEGAGAALQGVAIATDTLSGAGGLLNLVMDTQAAKFVVAKAQMVGSTIASGAQATATGVATAAQWLWNAALTANPIGLVVAGVALLIGGLVLAYAKVGPFRDAIDGAMGFAKDIIGDVADAIEGMVDWIKQADGPWDAIKQAADLALTPVKLYIEGISTVLQTAIGWVQDLIGWISRIDIPDVPGWLGGGDDRGLSLVGPTGKPTTGPDPFVDPWLDGKLGISLTVAPQDKDKAMADLVDALREFLARRGQTLSITGG
jgi:hypothetical protein